MTEIGENVKEDETPKSSSSSSDSESDESAPNENKKSGVPPPFSMFRTPELGQRELSSMGEWSGGGSKLWNTFTRMGLKQFYSPPLGASGGRTQPRRMWETGYNVSGNGSAISNASGMSNECKSNGSPNVSVSVSGKGGGKCSPFINSKHYQGTRPPLLRMVCPYTSSTFKNKEIHVEEVKDISASPMPTYHMRDLTPDIREDEEDQKLVEDIGSQIAKAAMLKLQQTALKETDFRGGDLDSEAEADGQGHESNTESPESPESPSPPALERPESPKNFEFSLNVEETPSEYSPEGTATEESTPETTQTTGVSTLTDMSPLWDLMNSPIDPDLFDCRERGLEPPVLPKPRTEAMCKWRKFVESMFQSRADKNQVNLHQVYFQYIRNMKKWDLAKERLDMIQDPVKREKARYDLIKYIQLEEKREQFTKEGRRVSQFVLRVGPHDQEGPFPIPDCTALFSPMKGRSCVPAPAISPHMVHSPPIYEQARVLKPKHPQLLCREFVKAKSFRASLIKQKSFKDPNNPPKFVKTNSFRRCPDMDNPFKETFGGKPPKVPGREILGREIPPGSSLPPVILKVPPEIRVSGTDNNNREGSPNPFEQDENKLSIPNALGIPIPNKLSIPYGSPGRSSRGTVCTEGEKTPTTPATPTTPTTNRSTVEKCGWTPYKKCMAKPEDYYDSDQDSTELENLQDKMFNNYINDLDKDPIYHYLGLTEPETA